MRSVLLSYNVNKLSRVFFAFREIWRFFAKLLVGTPGIFRTLKNSKKHSGGHTLKSNFSLVFKTMFFQAMGCQKNKCAGAFMATNVTVRKCINKTNQSLQAREFLQEYFQQSGK